MTVGDQLLHLRDQLPLFGALIDAHTLHRSACHGCGRLVRSYPQTLTRFGQVVSNSLRNGLMRRPLPRYGPLPLDFIECPTSDRRADRRTGAYLVGVSLADGALDDSLNKLRAVGFDPDRHGPDDVLELDLDQAPRTFANIHRARSL